MASDSDPHIDELLRWCSARDIQIDARIRVARGEDGSICVVSRDSFIEPRTTLVTIPKSAVLSAKSCALAEHTPQVTYGKGAQLGLALALYGELLRGSSSFWFGYLKSLPKHVGLPLFWDDTNDDEKLALSWIKGTMVEVELPKSTPEKESASVELSGISVTDLLHYYEFTVLPALSNAGFGDHATIEGFKHAYSLVSSRSFIVDVYHGLAMVPIADAFNHSLENQVHLESDYEVCRLCGSLTECLHDIEDEETDKRKSLPPSTVAEAVENTCDMVTNASILPFSEVFNTYGEHLTNAQLLLRYGFVLDVNENDVIAWDSPSLCHFAETFRGLTDTGEEYTDELCKNLSPVSTFAMHEGVPSPPSGRPEISYLHLEREVTAVEQAETHYRSTGGVIAFVQSLLRRLADVLELRDCEREPYSGSDLIYLADVMRTESKADIHDDCIRLNNETKSRNRAPVQSRKRTLTFFGLDSEGRISHHLWIFCALLALHARQPRLNASSDAVDQSESDTELSLNVPKRNKDATFGGYTSARSPESHHRNYRSEVNVSTTQRTSVSEDIAILRRALFIQQTLDKSTTVNQAEVSLEDIEKAWNRSSASRNVAKVSEGTDEKSLVPVVEASVELEHQRDAEALSSPPVPASQQMEEHPARLRKRERRRSTISSRSDGSRQRVRVRQDEHVTVDVKFYGTGEASEDAHEDQTVNISKSPIPTVEESPRGASWQGRKNGGLLSTLLNVYGDESDDGTHSDSDIVLSSAGGGGGLGRDNQYQESIGSLAGVGTREYPDRGSVARVPEKEENISDFRDRCAGVDYQSFDSRGTGTSGPIPELVHEKNCPRNTCLDALWLVASTARVICALCAARSHGMAYPNLDVEELGNIIDAIPSEMVKARMAAQLALDERVRLQGCIDAWSEIERVALQFENNAHHDPTGTHNKKRGSPGA